MRRLLTLLFALGAVLVLGAPSALLAAAPAQQDRELPVSWSVRPADRPGEERRANFVVDANPGEVVRDALVVENLGEVDLVLGVYASDAFNTAAGGIDLLASGGAPRDVGAWVRPAEPSITVAAGAAVEVPFEVSVPDDASAGDHVGGIVTSLTLSEPDAEGNTVRVERRLGSRLYVRVTGELDPALSFTELLAEYSANANPFAPGTMTVTYRVENTGNVRLRATREARVDGTFGGAKVAEAADIPELLPGNSFEYRQVVTGVWPGFGTDVGVELVPYEPTGLPLDPEPAPVLGRTSLTLLPVPQVALAIALVAVAVFLVWNRGRRRRELDTAVDRAVAEAMRSAADPTPTPQTTTQGR